MKTQINISHSNIDLFIKVCNQLQIMYKQVEDRENDARYEVETATASILFYLGQGLGLEIGHKINTETLDAFEHGK